MCKITELKLCTCGDISTKDFRRTKGIVWELRGKGDKKPFAGLFHTYGIFMIPEASEVTVHGDISADKLEQVLNSTSLFDFEYTPVKSDMLEIWDQTATTGIPKLVVTYVYDKKWYYVGNGSGNDHEDDYERVLISRGAVSTEETEK